MRSSLNKCHSQVPYALFSKRGREKSNEVRNFYEFLDKITQIVRKNTVKISGPHPLGPRSFERQKRRKIQIFNITRIKFAEKDPQKSFRPPNFAPLVAGKPKLGVY